MFLKNERIEVSYENKRQMAAKKKYLRPCVRAGAESGYVTREGLSPARHGHCTGAASRSGRCRTPVAVRRAPRSPRCDSSPAAAPARARRRCCDSCCRHGRAATKGRCAARRRYRRPHCGRSNSRSPRGGWPAPPRGRASAG